MTLWQYIKDSMLRRPDQCVYEGTEVRSFKEIVYLAEQFAKEIKSEHCCAVLCESEMAASIAILSCFAAEVTAVPISMRYGERHCQKILEMIGPSAIITDGLGKLQVNYVSDYTYAEPTVRPALIMCTSGTTGVPKGIMLSEKNILCNLQDILTYFAITEEDTILIARPLYHCAVLTGEFLVSLVKGLKICFYSRGYDPKILLEIISKQRITVFCGTPTLLSMLARFVRKNSCHSLKAICISGECLNAETGKQIKEAFENANIYHVYGLTEASPRVSYLHPNLFLKYPDSVGTPLASVSVKIMKDNDQVAETDEEGVLWVKGDNVMLGYYNAAETTRKAIVNGWLCTGDVAVFDTNGLLRIKGRCDELIIRAGMNIYPQEIEAAMKQDPRVREVLVFGIPSRYTGVQVAMKITGDFADLGEVRQLCIKVLPPFQIPAFIELLDELPQNGSGKIIRGGYYA